MKIFEFRGLNVKNSQFRNCEALQKPFCREKAPFLAKVEFAPFKALSLAEGVWGWVLPKATPTTPSLRAFRRKAKNPRFAKNA